MKQTGLDGTGSQNKHVVGFWISIATHMDAFALRMLSTYSLLLMTENHECFSVYLAVHPLVLGRPIHGVVLVPIKVDGGGRQTGIRSV